MEPTLSRSRFSTPFNHLTYLGMWTAETITNPTAKRLYLVGATFWHLILLTAITVQMIDLYFSIGNLRKLTFNFCTSVIVVGYTVKMLILYDRKDLLNDLRTELWQDSLSLNSEEDVALQDDAYSQLKFLKMAFYVSSFGILPIMFVSSYFSYKWGPRELPFAAYLPMSDPLDDSNYIPALVFEGICAFYVIFFVIEAELGMFGIILQVDAYYNILIKNLTKLNDIYADEGDVLVREEEGERKQTKAKVENAIKREVNVFLKQNKARKLLKVTVVHHLKLIEYIERFEFIYNRSMFVHTFAGSFLIIMNGIELILYLHEISIKFCFQIVFITMIIVDLVFVCYFLSRLSTQCGNVGNAAYSTFWYKMDPDLRRKIAMIILRSRRPPKVTAGKLLVMDSPLFLRLISNIYSWLMLFRQVLPSK